MSAKNIKEAESHPISDYKHVGKTKNGFDVFKHDDGHQLHMKRSDAVAGRPATMEWHHISKGADGSQTSAQGHGFANAKGHIGQFHSAKKESYAAEIGRVLAEACMALVSEGQYSLSHGQAFSHVPKNPDRTAVHSGTNTYKEFSNSDAMHKHLSGKSNSGDTWKAWHDSPGGARHKASKKVNEANDAFGNASTKADPKHPSYIAGKKLGSSKSATHNFAGKTYDGKVGYVHQAATNHAKDTDKRSSTLQDKLHMQRQFKAGAHAALGLKSPKGLEEAEYVGIGGGNKPRPVVAKKPVGRPMDQRKNALKNIKQALKAQKSWDGSPITPEEKAHNLQHAKELATKHGIPWNEVMASMQKKKAGVNEDINEPIINNMFGVKSDNTRIWGLNKRTGYWNQLGTTHSEKAKAEITKFKAKGDYTKVIAGRLDYRPKDTN